MLISWASCRTNRKAERFIQNAIREWATPDLSKLRAPSAAILLPGYINTTCIDLMLASINRRPSAVPDSNSVSTTS